jgi:hypothetical protein
VKVGGQEIDEKIIARIQEIIDSNPGLSRGQLSRRICEELKWRSRNGRLREVSCRIALLKLYRRGAIRLPEAAPFPARRNESRRDRKTDPPEAQVEGELKQLQPIELVRIT